LGCARTQLRCETLITSEAGSGKEATGMNRRTALLLTMLSGGLLPARLLAQQPGGVDDDPPRRPTRRAATKSQKKSAGDDLDAVPDDPPAVPRGAAPAQAEEDTAAGNSPPEGGQSWRTFDISRYTGLAHSTINPQEAIVEWIFRRTGTAIWHGEQTAVLSASKSQVRAYHNPRILKTVSDVVRLFTDSTADTLSIRVRFVAASDTRWRYLVFSRLQPIGSGPQGQQIWTLKNEDAAQILAQLQIYQGFKPLAEQRLKMINGQTLKVATTDTIDYASGLQRDNNAAIGFQQATGQLEEGIVLRLSPLLEIDGDTVEAAIDLKATTVRSMHRTRILTRREIGSGEVSIDVPEVMETRLNQTVKNWPLGQTLLISAGIHPGILQNKGGFLNLRIPGTVPTSTELLVFLDIDVADTQKTAKARGPERD
jgi:hypothetical protein